MQNPCLKKMVTLPKGEYKYVYCQCIFYCSKLSFLTMQNCISLEYLTIITFVFNGKYYLQIRTSMRSKVSPIYVSLAYLEFRRYEKVGQDYCHEIKEKFIKDWMRYLDDCFLHWDTSIDTVDNLHLKL